jgi:hypothetical protein
MIHHRIEPQASRAKCYIEAGVGQGNGPIFGAYWDVGNDWASVRLSGVTDRHLPHKDLEEWARAYLALRAEEAKR